MTEEELSKAKEEVSKELDGKTKEELEAMENNANEELQKQIINDACTYIWNLMELGDTFSKEKYDEIVRQKVEEVKNGTSEPFSRWSDESFALNQTIMLHGYGNFGKEFVDRIMSKDIESAKVVLETALQSYLELRGNYEGLLNALQTVAQEKEAAKAETKE